MEITYTNHEGFYLPNLTLPRKEEAPQRGRPASTGDAGAAGEADGTEARHHRADESRKSDGMGRCHEHHPQRRGGDGDAGGCVRITK